MPMSLVYLFFKCSLFHQLIPFNLKALDPFLPVDGRETDNVLINQEQTVLFCFVRFRAYGS